MNKTTMKLSVIQLEQGAAAISRELSFDTPAKFSATIQTLTSPTVWVIPDTALPDLARFSDLIEDRGVKHKDLELSRVLLHGDRPRWWTATTPRPGNSGRAWRAS